MLFFLVAYRNVGWTWLLYPVIFVGTAVFASAYGYILAVAHVHFRDTAQIFGIVMQLWFFLTPIMYPIEMIPEETNGIPLRGHHLAESDDEFRRMRPVCFSMS